MLSIYAGLVIDIPVVRLKWQLLKEKNPELYIDCAIFLKFTDILHS